MGDYIGPNDYNVHWQNTSAHCMVDSTGSAQPSSFVVNLTVRQVDLHCVCSCGRRCCRLPHRCSPGSHHCPLGVLFFHGSRPPPNHPSCNRSVRRNLTLALYTVVTNVQRISVACVSSGQSVSAIHNPLSAHPPDEHCLETRLP